MFIGGVHLDVDQSGPLNIQHVFNAQIEVLLFVRVDINTVCGVSDVQTIFDVSLETRKWVKVSYHHVEVESQAPVVVIAVFLLSALP